MWDVLKSIMAGVAVRLLRDYRRLSLDILKIRAVYCYVSAVAGARMAFLGYVGLLAGLLLALAGFVMAHIGLFILLPFTAETKGVILLVLGLVYVAVPALILRRAASQATWMKISRADELVAKVTERKP